MATTFVDYTGDGNATKTFSFPSYKVEDIKVKVDDVLKTSGNHYNITSYTTTGGGNVVFTSGNIPASPADIHIYRDTDVDSAKATYTAGSSVKAGDLNNNHTQLLYALQEEQNQLVRVGNIKDAAITTAKIKADNITSALIADNQINSEHYVDESIDTQHIGNSQVTTVKIAADNITNALIADSQIDSEHYVDGSIDREHLTADIIDGTKIADDSINSEHYVDASIDEQHIANSAVTSNKIADNAVTTTEILNGAVTTAKLAADAIDGTKLADNAIDSEHYTDGSIDRVHLEADIIDSTKLADNAVNSEHYVDGSIDHVHLANDIIDGDNIQNDVVNSEHIAAGALDNEHYAAGSITSDKLNGATVVTNSEQSGYSVNDTSFFTTSAAEARYFNASTGETIKDGESFPDNDTTIATTAAINDRIIDLVDDVGGFVPIANETSFPNANPDVNNGTGTIVSISTLASNHTSSGSGVISISNGTVGNSTVTINGAANSTTYSAGYGLLVETTTTLNTYTFHRLVPKATEVTTVAGKATEIGRLGTAAAVEDMSILGTTDVVADLNTLGTADVVSDMNALAVSDVISDMNTLAVSGVISDMDTVATNVTNVNNVGGSIANVNTTAGSIGNVNTVAGSIANVNTTAGSISNVNTTAGSISNVNTVASNISSVNSFANTYRIGADNPTTSLDTGDLFFNTTSDSLKVYTGSAWVDGVTATGNFALKTGNTFTGSNIHNDNVKALFGTGSDLQIYHDGSNSYVQDTGTGDLRLKGSTIRFRSTTSESMIGAFENGAVEIYYDNAKKFETTSGGATVTGNVFVTGSFRGDDNSKLDLGNSNDLQIYHDGNSRIVNTNGIVNLVLQSDYMTFRANHANEDYIKCVKNAQVELYYDNSKKFETTSTGATITSNGSQNGLSLVHSNGNTSAILRHVGTGDEGEFHLKDGGSTLLYLSGASGGDSNITTGGNFDLEHDSAKLRLGAGNDLQIFHDGTNSWLDNSTGDLYVRNTANNEHIIVQAGLGGQVRLLVNAGESALRAYTNGAVELYYDNSKKFETTSAGVTIEGSQHRFKGDVRFDNNTNAEKDIYFDESENRLNFFDDVKATFGNSNDLQIYHEGTDSWIRDAGTGRLLIDGSEVHIRKYGAAETMAKFIEDGAVELYYDNSKKFETANAGVILNGSAHLVNSGNFYPNSDGSLQLGLSNRKWSSINGVSLNINGGDAEFRGTTPGTTDMTWDQSENALNFDDNVYAHFGTGDDLKIYHNGTNSYIVDTGTGELRLGTTTGIRLTKHDSETLANFVPDGAAELYYDNGKRIETTTYGITVTGNSNNPTTDSWDTNSSIITSGTYGGGIAMIDGSAGFVQSLDGNGANYYLRNATTTSTPETSIKAVINGAVELYYDNSKKLETTSAGINVSGNIRVPDNESIRIGTHDDLQIIHTPNNSFLNNGTGSLYLNSAVHIYLGNADNSEYKARFHNNGTVELYYDNSKKFETISAGCQVTGNIYVNDGNTFTAGGNNDATFFHNGTDTYIQNSTGKLRIGNTHSDEIKFYTNNGTRWNVGGSGHIYPDVNNTYDIGTSTYRVRNIYTNDLNLSNEGSSNDVDGTWGNWTIQEGESDLFLKNNRSGKKYKFNLTEVS